MMYIQVHANFHVSEHLQQLIEEKVNKLATFHDRITGADIFLKAEEKRHEKPLEQTVELNIQIPGQVLHTEEHAESYEKSLYGAVDKMRIQLLKHKGQLHPHI